MLSGVPLRKLPATQKGALSPHTFSVALPPQLTKRVEVLQEEVEKLTKSGGKSSSKTRKAAAAKQEAAMQLQVQRRARLSTGSASASRCWQGASLTHATPRSGGGAAPENRRERTAASGAQGV